jgi:hypothetical protein
MEKELIDQELTLAAKRSVRPAKQFIVGEHLCPFVWYTKKTCSYRKVSRTNQQLNSHWGKQHHMKIKESICKEVHHAQVIQLYEKDSCLV